MIHEAVTLINLLQVEPAKQEMLVSLLKQNVELVVSKLDGWKGTRLIAAADGSSVVIYSEWESAEAVDKMRADPRMQAYFPKIRELASLISVMGEPVMNEKP